MRQGNGSSVYGKSGQGNGSSVCGKSGQDRARQGKVGQGKGRAGRGRAKHTYQGVCTDSVRCSRCSFSHCTKMIGVALCQHWPAQ